MLPTKFEIEFAALRKQVNYAIEYQRKHGEPGKIYDGAWELFFMYPPQDEDPDAIAHPEQCIIRLHSYLVGPSRHYSWIGKSCEEALARCKKVVDKWCREVYED